MSESNKLTDLSYLRSLTGNANDKMAKYIRMFTSGASLSLQQIEMYSLNKDWDSVKQSAHALKPQLGYFGAKGTEELLREIERMSGDKVDLDRIPEALKNLKVQLDIIVAELELSLKEFE
jgi:HPt (histidine-containing phosphotransfer) domain-containing protein